jgi:hypothetical protein
MSDQSFNDAALVTATAVCADCGNISSMTLWRWMRDPQINFPQPDVIIRGRRYWRGATVKSVKARLASAGGVTHSPERQRRKAAGAPKT